MREEITYYKCSACGDRRLEGLSKQAARSGDDQQECPECATRSARGTERRVRATPKARALARRAEGRPAWSSKRHVNYVESGSSDDEIGRELQRAVQIVGLLFTVTDPRHVGKDTSEAGSVVLNVDEVRQILRDEQSNARQNWTVWLTTRQMAWPIHAEEGRSREWKGHRREQIDETMYCSNAQVLFETGGMMTLRQRHRLRP